MLYRLSISQHSLHWFLLVTFTITSQEYLYAYQLHSGTSQEKSMQAFPHLQLGFVFVVSVDFTDCFLLSNTPLGYHNDRYTNNRAQL